MHQIDLIKVYVNRSVNERMRPNGTMYTWVNFGVYNLCSYKFEYKFQVVFLQWKYVFCGSDVAFSQHIYRLLDLYVVTRFLGYFRAACFWDFIINETVSALFINKFINLIPSRWVEILLVRMHPCENESVGTYSR